MKQMHAVPDDEIDKMTHANAMRLFNYDPFTTLGGRENCNVAALRDPGRGLGRAIKAQGIKATGTGAMDLLKIASGGKDK